MPYICNNQLKLNNMYLYASEHDLMAYHFGKKENHQCGSCEQEFEEPVDNECPHCGSGNFVEGNIDEQ